MGKRTLGYTTDVTVDVEVDLDEALEMMEDDDLLQEVRNRGFELKNDGHPGLEREDLSVLIAALSDVTPRTEAWWVREKLYEMLGA